MTTPTSPTTPPAPGRRAAFIGGTLLTLLFVAVAGGLLALVLFGRNGAGTADAGTVPGATPDPESFAFADPVPAPALELTDHHGQPFSLASLHGRPVLVFFGYTHCPDVCPTTVGTVNQVLAAVGDGPRAVFTSIDPERDDVEAMGSYMRYLPTAYVGLSGTPGEVAENAVRWGVQYARIDQDSASGYAMAHTADLFLVDGEGLLRARFPFGTEAPVMIDAVRGLLAELPPPSDPPATAAPVAVATPAPTTAPATAAPTTQATPTPAATAPPVADVVLYPEVISSSIWAGSPDPVILRVKDSTGVTLDGSEPVTVQVAGFDGTPQGDPVAAEALLPEGETHPYFVADVSIPAAGAWRLRVTAGALAGDIPIQVLDPGTTVEIGGAAPAIDTPTLDDVGGVVRAVTTQPQPDLRLSRTSTADALAMGKPYVIVIDSARFKVSPECGRALTMIRYLLDRWDDEAVFVHLEPFEYTIITQEPVLSGSLTDPPLNEDARAFGLGDRVWPGVKMPWIFVVDAQGVVRAKYTGIVGSRDIDVILTRILGEGRIGG